MNDDSPAVWEDRNNVSAIASAYPDQEPGRPDRILLVAHNLLTREMLANTLMLGGFEIVSTANMAGAQRFLDRYPPSYFDCVVSDYDLPDRNGLELAGWISSIDKSFGFILLMEAKDHDAISKTYRVGVSEILAKPVPAESLIDAVSRAADYTRHNRKTKNNRYLINKSQPLGVGGVASIFLGHDRLRDRPVAIKRLIYAAMDIDASDADLFKEAIVLSTIKHPNVVEVYDWNVDNDGPYIVMEYIHGKDLEQYVEEHYPLHETDLHDIARQSLQALAAAHSVGLLHRDVKPSNIMVTQTTGNFLFVKILDFGLAKLLGVRSQQTNQTISVEGAIKGSVYNTAPEQLDRSEIDHRVDLYAFGCSLFFAAAGVDPILGEEISEILQSHLNHNVLDIRECRPDLTERFCDFIKRLMAHSPDDRPPSAFHALMELDGIPY